MRNPFRKPRAVQSAERGAQLFANSVNDAFGDTYPRHPADSATDGRVTIPRYARRHGLEGLFSGGSQTRRQRKMKARVLRALGRNG